MSEQIYGIDVVLKLFSESGVKLSRQAFNHSHMPHLLKGGWATKPFGKRGGVIFDKRYLQHWIEYVAEVKRRQATGKMAGNYDYNEWDMQCYIDGAWDD